MSSNEALADPSPAEPAPSWREQAVARSLDPARLRAEKRVQRFLDAALELMSTSPNKDFTVQEVVERSGQSLRSFYQYFAGKHELLLALFEESVRSTAEHLREVVEAETDPGARLRTFTVEYYRICRPPGAKGKQAKKAPPAPLMAEFAQQLLTERPKEASRAFGPLLSLFEEVLDAAAAAGEVRADLDHRSIAGIVLQAIMFNTFASTISGSSVRDEAAASGQLWELLLHGIGTPAA